MPFTLIKGTFRLLNRRKDGAITGFEPDGDSIQFKANKPSLLRGLPRLVHPLRPTNIGSVNLRFEGIDALELHFEGENQPRPLSDDARDFLTLHLRLDPVDYHEPREIRVKPPAPNDGAPGFILSRTLEKNGRPVSFVFAGNTQRADGSSVHLTVPMLRKSLNYQLLLAGHAYPLFYDLLFHDLRGALTGATQAARKAGRGIWAADRSRTGVTVVDQASLETTGVIFPKLFRRLTTYFGDGHKSLTGFVEWVEAKKEQVVDLTQNINFTHFENIIDVDVPRNRVRMLRDPEQVVFVSEK